MEKRIKLGYLGRQISINRIKLIRGYSYVSMIGIPFLVARELERIFPSLPWWIIFIVAVVGIWIGGHIDFKWLWKNELEYTLTKNPEWVRRVKEMVREELKGKNEKVRKRIPRRKA
jgi:hypothetical protein